MIVLPAIDLLGGEAVRLRQGDYDQVTVYNEDPADQARLFADAGAEWIHVVDLDGARAGRPMNLEAVARITQASPAWIELGGGLRSLDDLEAAFDAGVDRFVLGTSLVTRPDFARQAAERFPGRIVAGVDARDGLVSIEGWMEGTVMSALELIGELKEMGISRVAYTDIMRDGTGAGVDAVAYSVITRAAGIPVIASGGVASLDDVAALRDAEEDIDGVIVGRALYEGAFTLEDALSVASGRSA